jgi:hypothetical protein
LKTNDRIFFFFFLFVWFKGGDTLSITKGLVVLGRQTISNCVLVLFPLNKPKNKGIVSRIEAGPYTETLEMLTIQIDAAINPGNSGGCLFFVLFCFVSNDFDV